MGCDIHSFIEVKQSEKWVCHRSELYRDEPFGDRPFGDRYYGIFGFLANVRNYSDLLESQRFEPKGFPEDASKEVKDEFCEWSGDAHTPSWILIKDLLEFDYSQTIEDRRTTKRIHPRVWDGSAQTAAGYGKEMTLKDFLGEYYFSELEKLKRFDPENTRLVFWFDN